MSECYFCYWGWPPEIQEIYDRAMSDLEAQYVPGAECFDERSAHSVMHFGPAHIVWEDENFDHAGWCVDNFDKYSDGLTEEQKTIVLRSLKELVQVPEALKVAPEGEPYHNPPPWGEKL